MVAQIDGEYVRARPTRLWSRMLSYALFEGRPLTTRGRWINPAVFGLSSCLRRMPVLRPVERPAFILGTGRSGTTALGLVLSMHADVGFLNEPKALWAALHQDEDLIGSYNRSPARYRLTADDVTPDLEQAAHRIFGGYLRLAGARRLVDKYPEMIFRVAFLRRIFPDARFLFLSRSGIATCSSINLWSRRHGASEKNENHDWWGADDRKWKLIVEQLVPEHPDLAIHASACPELDHVGRAAVEWIVTMREGIRMMSDSDGSILHVPYEALCAAPAEWARRLQEFLCLPRDRVFEDFAQRTLRDPQRQLSIRLPQWLRTPFDETQRELDRFSHGTSISL